LSLWWSREWEVYNLDKHGQLVKTHQAKLIQFHQINPTNFTSYNNKKAFTVKRININLGDAHALHHKNNPFNRCSAHLRR
jgi:hypothetical protein